MRKKKRFIKICNQIRIKKLPDPSESKEYYQSYLKKTMAKHLLNIKIFFNKQKKQKKREKIKKRN